MKTNADYDSRRDDAVARAIAYTAMAARAEEQIDDASNRLATAAIVWKCSHRPRAIKQHEQMAILR